MNKPVQKKEVARNANFQSRAFPLYPKMLAQKSTISQDLEMLAVPL